MHKYVVRINKQPVIDENGYACIIESQAKTIVAWLKGNRVDAEYMTIEKWEELKTQSKE